MTRIPETEDRLSSQAEGVWIDGRYLARADAHQCVRCGLWRRVSKHRATSDICKDCKTVEKPGEELRRWLKKQPNEPAEGVPVKDRAGIVRWVKPARIERMTAEDMAWCERAATAWFWADWERQNRRESLPLQTMHKARELASRMSTGTRNAPVDDGLPVSHKEAFHEAAPTIERTA